MTEALFAHRLERLAEGEERRCRKTGLVVERAEVRAAAVVDDASDAGERNPGQLGQRLLEKLNVSRKKLAKDETS
jgi:hypothetical protein